jgi:hypothetical protein
MRFPTVLALIILGSGTLGAVRAGDIYCNNQGRDCSDRPSPGATYVRTANPPSAGRSESSPAAGSNGSNGGTTAAAPTEAAAARLGMDAARAATQKDVAATRAEQCKQAKDKYQKAVEARRVYRLNSAGEREYLSDAEADQARLNARLEMERSCGSSAS